MYHRKVKEKGTDECLREAYDKIKRAERLLIRSGAFGINDPLFYQLIAIYGYIARSLESQAIWSEIELMTETTRADNIPF